MASTPWDDELTSRLRQRFPDGIREFATYLDQHFMVVDVNELLSVLDHLRTYESYDFLTDLTAVDWPEKPLRFELVYMLYSRTENRRVRVKTSVADGAKAPSITGLFPSANWLEREVFDLFGIDFAGHPDMRRILMPDEWHGHPLRRDYGITQMDNQWVKDNLNIPSGQ